jgi:hypothetical protein
MIRLVTLRTGERSGQPLSHSPVLGGIVAALRRSFPLNETSGHAIAVTNIVAFIHRGAAARIDPDSGPGLP